jgi:hypothetical protein
MTPEWEDAKATGDVPTRAIPSSIPSVGKADDLQRRASRVCAEETGIETSNAHSTGADMGERAGQNL